MRLILFFLLLTTFLLSKESCLNCHQDTTSIDSYHDVKIFGCASCHGGDKKAKTKQKAHKNMVLNPSRLEHAEIFCAKCHKDIINRVKNSLMNTQSAILDVLKYQFKESEKIVKSNGIKDLINKPKAEQSLAEDHFSKLCAACHINQKEDSFKTLQKRGGGCANCHRVSNTKIVKKDLKPKIIHSKFSTKIPSKTCLKCHNRSNRIGLSYFGKFESEGYGTPFKDAKLNNKLDKSRFFYKLPADIHHTKANLDCIDCHTQTGVMGDKKIALHMEDALDISCKDCHKAKFKNSKDYPLSSLLSALNGNIPNFDTIAITHKKNTPLYNVTNENNQTFIYRKKDGKKFKITQISNKAYHTQEFHKRLDCSACHSKWIPSCYGCHEVYFKNSKQYDWIKHKYTKGAWMELRSYLRYESPTLSIGYNKKIMPSAPGCQVLMNIYDENNFSKPFNSFAYAAWSPHTISKESRECIDCHFNPKTLGLGDGILKYENTKFKFYPFFDSNKSGLDINFAIDSLIDINGTQYQSFSRDNARGFNKKEILKILNAYKCIICHRDYDDKIYKNFNESKKLFYNKKTKCSKELLK